MRLLLLALLLCSGVRAEWDVEFFKLDNLYRADLLGPAGGKLVQSIACYSMHAIGVGQDCDSPGFFRHYFPADQLIMLVPIIPGMHTLIDAITSDGERCVRELPRERIAVTVETGPEAQTVPWYYYTIVIIACCVIGVAVLMVGAGVWKGKQHPYSVAFVNAYQSSSTKNKRIAAETLGLFQPQSVLAVED